MVVSVAVRRASSLRFDAAYAITSSRGSSGSPARITVLQHTRRRRGLEVSAETGLEACVPRASNFAKWLG